MELINFRRVAIKSLKLPGDIKERTHKKNVIDLAASIAALGGEPAQPPLVQNGTRLLIAGRDRVAACMVNKTPRIWVRVVEADDDEIARLELDENLQRRQDNRERMLAQSAKLEEAKLKAAAKEEAAKAKEAGTDVPPTKKATKKAAREVVAKKAGVKPESVRKAVQRQAAKEKAKDAPPKPEKPPIDTLGLDIGKGLLNACALIKEAMETLDNQSKAAQHVINKSSHRLPPQRVIRLMDTAKLLGAQARDAMPVMVCYECKGEGTEKCPVCKGAHYACADQMHNVPKEKLMHPPKNGVQAEAQP